MGVQITAMPGMRQVKLSNSSQASTCKRFNVACVDLQGTYEITYLHKKHLHLRKPGYDEGSWMQYARRIPSLMLFLRFIPFLCGFSSRSSVNRWRCCML